MAESKGTNPTRHAHSGACVDLHISDKLGSSLSSATGIAMEPNAVGLVAGYLLVFATVVDS